MRQAERDKIPNGGGNQRCADDESRLLSVSADKSFLKTRNFHGSCWKIHEKMRMRSAYQVVMLYGAKILTLFIVGPK